MKITVDGESEPRSGSGTERGRVNSEEAPAVPDSKEGDEPKLPTDSGK